MSDPGMVLREEDVRRIAEYVKPWLRNLVSETVWPRSHDLSAQIVRVAEELKGQRELFAERFEAMDQRFVEMQRHTDKRFDAVDQRFEAMDQRFADMQRYMDRRFESMDRRFGAMQWTMLFGFTIVTVAVTVFGLLA